MADPPPPPTATADSYGYHYYHGIYLDYYGLCHRFYHDYIRALHPSFTFAAAAFTAFTVWLLAELLRRLLQGYLARNKAAADPAGNASAIAPGDGGGGGGGDHDDDDDDDDDDDSTDGDDDSDASASYESPPQPRRRAPRQASSIRATRRRPYGQSSGDDGIDVYESPPPRQASSARAVRRTDCSIEFVSPAPQPHTPSRFLPPSPLPRPYMPISAAQSSP